MVWTELDFISALVHMAMVCAAQQRGVRKAGLAAIRPVLDMMSFQEHPVGAVSGRRLLAGIVSVISTGERSGRSPRR
jgi:hypothetical protein